jgi:hypothetical protein
LFSILSKYFSWEVTRFFNVRKAFGIIPGKRSSITVSALIVFALTFSSFAIRYTFGTNYSRGNGRKVGL